jgi:hypothetical protein
MSLLATTPWAVFNVPATSEIPTPRAVTPAPAPLTVAPAPAINAPTFAPATVDAIAPPT